MDPPSLVTPWEKRPVTQPTSPVFFKKIKVWLEECEAGISSGHRMCVSDEASHLKLPTRLLKIRQEEGEFKVSLEQEHLDTIKYASLSHCWGKYQPLRTTKENLEHHVREIKWSTLPKTFQDAVIISHGLGIDYLWIDSLCIIQDDEVDWTREAAQMKDVYARAYVTIAAATGRDSRHGLFPRELSDDSTGQDEDSERCARYSVWTTSILSDRAWVMQERLLSRRTLYFYEDEVLLECPSSLRCQCNGSTSLSTSPISYQSWALMWGDARQCIDNDSILYRFTQARRHMNESPESQRTHGPELAPHSSSKTIFAISILWDELLEQYCQRSITKLGDRLSALSGIAWACGNSGIFGDYAAGLWDGLFLPLMLWYIEPGNSPKLERPSEADPALAPSWSWASVRGAWRYRRMRPASESYAVATHYEPDSAEQNRQYFGAVKKGVVTIEGLLATATIQYDTLCSDCEQDPEFTYADRFRAQKVELVADDERIEMWADFVFADIQNPVKPGEEVYCLPIRGDSESEPRIMQGLVLRVDKNNSDLFSRIGVFQSHIWFGSSEVVDVKIC